MTYKLAYNGSRTLPTAHRISPVWAITFLCTQHAAMLVISLASQLNELNQKVPTKSTRRLEFHGNIEFGKLYVARSAVVVGGHDWYMHPTQSGDK